jgi:glycosyltransferase involved in cell wall biosynthesis
VHAEPLTLTILINNHNYGAYLRESIDSALEQTHPRIEIVVVDDGSTDESADVIRSYADRIVPVFQANGGQASAFNTGFAHATGDVICLLDADDVFEPQKAAEIMNAYREFGEIGWCYHPLALFGEVAEASVRPAGLRRSFAYDFRSRLVQGCSPLSAPATSGLSFKRNLLETILPMPATIKITADNYIKFASFGLSKGYLIHEPLARQRIHSRNHHTLRSDRTIPHADTTLQTAAALRERFPTTSRFANRLFAKGLAALPRAAREAGQRKKLLDSYLELTTLPERVEISMRLLRYRAQRCLRVWH